MNVGARGKKSLCIGEVRQDLDDEKNPSAFFEV
jgi:hypothetical protein